MHEKPLKIALIGMELEEDWKREDTARQNVERVSERASERADISSQDGWFPFAMDSMNRSATTVFGDFGNSEMILEHTP